MDPGYCVQGSIDQSPSGLYILMVDFFPSHTQPFVFSTEFLWHHCLITTRLVTFKSIRHSAGKVRH